MMMSLRTFDAQSAQVYAAAAVSAMLVLAPLPASADIVTESVEYQVDEEAFEGYVARNEAVGDERPTVLIVHDWDGVTDYEMRRAEMLAQSGYNAFAIDVFGQDVRPQTSEESQEATGALYQDRETFRQRLMGGLDALADLPGINADNVVVIGYCFGGAGVLEMARAGVETDGFVVFHGGLSTPDDQDYDAVTAPMLLLHGSSDPVSPMAQFAELTTALDEAEVDHQAMIFGGARHAFSVWSNSDYDLAADEASWQALLDFLSRN